MSPFEVERILKDHPAVADSAVIREEVGPDKTIIVAYILLGVRVRSPARRRLSPTLASTWPATECPRIVHFVADLPRTANGKVLRRALRLTN